MVLNATPEQGTDVLKVTDEETGMLTISGLKHDQYYALVEKSAKDGFVVRVEPYYFVLPGTNNLRMPAGVEGKEFTACFKDINPALTKPITNTVVALELCRTAVTSAPANIPHTAFRVSTPNTFFILSPATF